MDIVCHFHLSTGHGILSADEKHIRGLDGGVREGQPTICSSYIGGFIYTVGII